MDYKILKIAKKDKVVTVTISRPDSLNALNSYFFKEMDHFLDSVKFDKSVAVVILTGEGKAFAAGADISEMSGKDYPEALHFSIVGQNTFSKIASSPKIFIAAVNGFALGGGCELAMACDFRLASKKAKFGQPEVKLGLIPGYAGTQRLTTLVGLGNALYLLTTAEMIDAETALRMGLVQQIIEPEELLIKSDEIAKLISSYGPDAVSKVKLVTREGFDMHFQNGCTKESDEFATLFEGEGREGMKAFLEKRNPNW